MTSSSSSSPKETRAKLKAHLGEHRTFESHPNFDDALADLVEAEARGLPLFGEAMSDPRGFLRGRDMEVPADWRVTLTKDSPLTLTICFNSLCRSYVIN